MATMTLAQAARHMEESGTQIKVGSFESFDQFMSYFNQHYKPMLESLQSDATARLIRFFIDDMLEAFSVSNDND